jgi:outer membrane immunogenic protein
MGDTMKKVLVASVALIALGTGIANAADLPVKTAPAPVYVPSPFTWTGCYIGGNVGGLWAQTSWADTLSGLTWSNNSTSGRFIGGGEGGCNYQMGTFVIGIEGDFDWAGNKNDTNGAIVGPLGHSFLLTSNNNWVSTAAARFGFAFDRGLLYFKAGGGWVGNNGFTVTDLTTGASFSGSNTNSAGGWLVGVGAEYAFTNHWTAKLEYDYLGLGSQTVTLPGAVIPALAGDTIHSGSNRNVQMVKLGVNYLFNWSNPVVARY